MTTIHKAAWIHVADRKVLFARSKGKTVLYCPGGKLEYGESGVDALVREVEEEVSVQLIPDSIVEMMTFTAPADGRVDTDVQAVCFFADYTGLLAPASEIEELVWLTHKDTENLSPLGHLILAWLHERGDID